MSWGVADTSTWHSCDESWGARLDAAECGCVHPQRSLVRWDDAVNSDPLEVSRAHDLGRVSQPCCSRASAKGLFDPRSPGYHPARGLLGRAVSWVLRAEVDEVRRHELVGGSGRVQRQFRSSCLLQAAGASDAGGAPEQGETLVQKSSVCPEKGL